MSLSKRYLAFLIMLLAILLAGCSERKLEAPVTLQGDIFGTFYQVTIADPITAERRDALEQGILDELEAVDASMSTYRDDAELVAFNKSPVDEWQTLSAPLIHVMDIARSVGEASGGAFDVTVGGLVNLWSFGPEARPEEVPPMPHRAASCRGRHGDAGARCGLESCTAFEGCLRRSFRRGQGVCH